MKAARYALAALLVAFLALAFGLAAAQEEEETGAPSAGGAGGAAPAAAKATPIVAAASGAITWQEAMNKLGQEVVVEATIIKVYDPEARGGKGPVKLNVDPDYRSSLTFVFYKKDRQGNDAGFGDPNRYLNKKVRVKGKVEEYRGSKQIMLRSPSDIQIIK